MKSSTFTSIAVIICFAALTMLGSCKHKHLDKHLYPLYIELDSVQAQLKSDTTGTDILVLNFYVDKVDDSDVFTLRGWFPTDTSSYHIYAPKPELKLKVRKLGGGEDTLMIDPGTYLGNSIIDSSTVEAIMRIRPSANRFLFFLPHKGYPHNPGHIYYDIKSSETPNPRDATTDVGSANPSPPRPSNGTK